jgi:WD40 repeat protein
VYEKCDDKREPYYEIRGYTLEVTNFIGGAILPTEDRLILVSNEGRLVSVGIGQHDIPGEKDSDLATVVATDLFPGGFHDGSILATDIAFHRSVCVTIGSDSTLRIWNFETLKCELVHKFTSEGDPIGLAIHPSGFQVIVSFKEKVKLFNIYLDKLKLFQESVSKSLKELKFSNSGQYWAAASTINVMIYDTTTFTQILCFQGHMMAIKRIAWGPGDHYIFSAGADGNVYGWSLEQDHRIDVIASSNRSNSIQGLAIDGADTSLVGLNLQRIVGRTTVEWGGGGGSGGAGGGSGTGDGATSASSGALVGTTSAADPSSFVIGTYCAVISSQDGTMKFAEWKPPNIYDGKLNNPSRGSDDTSSNAITLHLAGGDAASSGATSGGANYMSVVIISTCKKFLYAGMSDGSLRVYEWPVKTHTPSYIEIQAHSSAVVDLRESPTGHILITASEDGSIFIHSILKGQLAALSGAGTSGGGDTSGSYDLYSSMAASASELGGFIYNSDTVQIAKDDMDDHIQEVYDQRKKIEEMNTKFAFEMHQVYSLILFPPPSLSSLPSPLISSPPLPSLFSPLFLPLLHFSHTMLPCLISSLTHFSHLTLLLSALLCSPLLCSPLLCSAVRVKPLTTKKSKSFSIVTTRL